MEPMHYPQNPILIVDDESFVVDSITIALATAGITNTIGCPDPRTVASILAEKPVELMILDLTMPYLTGTEILESSVKNYPHIPVIIVTSTGELDTVVRCMKMGASDYLLKPVEKSLLIATVKNCIRMKELERENRLLSERVVGGLQRPEFFNTIITESERMRALFKYIESIGPSGQPVLITGETGVGKELVARAVHTASGRTGQLIAVNVAGLDDMMFSDTLFGHRKGAYTGADTARTGLIKEAAGGTLFLDEIGDITQQSQVKLLRLLQEREYYPLGSDMPLRSDARIIAATNKNIEKAQESGEFRKDLYYRFAAHRIHVPPLRERHEDIPALVDHFMKKAADELGKKKPTYPAELIPLLKVYHFPGNVRELEMMIHDAVSRHESHVISLEYFKQRIIPDTTDSDVTHEPAAAAAAVEISGDHFPSLNEMEKIMIAKAMERSSNNQGVAARLLGITRTTLNSKLKSLRTPPDNTDAPKKISL
ncbi:MAG: sigma-54-dependent Fis family transcriptional regulator [Spirochaetes bacterium]|nr:sigma-54-dependent Fis family transcriptional regulator [Spirochaetota bacterium]